MTEPLRISSAGLQVVHNQSLDPAPLRITSGGLQVVHTEGLATEPLRISSAGLQVIWVGIPPDAPTITASADGTSIQVETSPFASADPAGEHTSTRYQVRLATDPDWATPAYDEVTAVFLTSVLLEDFAEGTTFDVRAFHIDRGVPSPASNVAQVETGGPSPVPNAPTISDPPDEVGVDVVRSTMAAFSHPEGQTTLEEYDPDDPLPYLLEVHWQIDVAAGDYSDPVYDSDRDGGPPIPEDALNLFFEGLTPGTAYKKRGRQRDGHHGTLSPWSNEVTFTTLEVPAERPAAPTVTLVSCTHEGISLTADAMTHPDGSAVHTRTHWRACQGSCAVYVTDVASELQSHSWPFPPEGTWNLSARYEDDDGRVGDYSEAVACTIDPAPPQVVVTSPVGGAVIDSDTLIQWEVPFDPQTGEWAYTLEASDDNGQTWTELFSGSEPEHLFTILGRANGSWRLRVRACYADSSHCGDWFYFPLTIDRTGVRAVSYDFTELDEFPDTWEVFWDGAAQGTHWELVDHGLHTGGAPIGIMARHTVYRGSRRSVLGFTELGKPRVGRYTAQFAVLGREDITYGWRYTAADLCRGGLGWSVTGNTGNEDRDGLQHLVHSGIAPWPCPDGQCGCAAVSDHQCSECRRLNLLRSREHPESVWRYGTSYRRAGVERVQMFDGAESFILRASATVPAAGARAQGMSVGTRDDLGATCIYRPIWYSIEQVVDRVGDDFRIRVNVSGPGLGEAGWHLTTTIRPEDFRFNDGCGYCGLAFYQLRGLDGTLGILFRSASFSDLEYEECEGPDDPLFGCEGDWDFTMFEDDDVTPWYGEADAEGQVVEADFYDTRDCPRPFLLPPRDFSETEIDFPAGASTIGAIKVGVLDKRTDPEDPDTGIVTARISEAIGRRGVLRRWREDLGMVTVFDGVVEAIEVDEGDIVVYWFYLRDPRERERNTDLFSRNETFAIWPQLGPVDPYGERPDGSFLISAAPTASGTFDLEAQEGAIHRGSVVVQQDVFVGLGQARLTELLWPSFDSSTGRWAYLDITFRWRPAAGGDWTYLRDMPSTEFREVFRDGTMDPDPDTTLRAYFASLDPDDLPEDEQQIEYQLLAVRTTEATPFMWDRGTFGDLLLEIYDGEHSVSQPRIRFSRPALEAFAEATPRARLRVTEPEPNLREWVQEHIYAPLGYAPGFDADMRIIPLQWELPPGGVDLVELNPDWIIPVGQFRDEVESVVNRVTYTYIREYVRPNLPDENLPEWQRLEEREVIRDYRFLASEFMASNRLEYEPMTVRAIGSPTGAALSGDSMDELGSQLADDIGRGVLDRFGWGAPEFQAGVRAGMAHGPSLDPHTLDLSVGEWVIARIPWQPDYPDRAFPFNPADPPVRGARRLMQIKSITDPEISERRILLIDGGPLRDPLAPPTLGFLTESDRRVVVPVEEFPTSAPDEYRARVQHAISVVMPAVDSGLWRTSGTIAEPGDVLTPEMPTGATVWIRARGEAPGYRPSVWTTPDSIVIADGPTLTSLTLFLSGGVPVISWTWAGGTAGVRLEISVGLIGHTPSYSTSVDLPMDYGAYSPPALLVGDGEEVYVRATPWSTFTGGAVGGESGTPLITSQRRIMADAPNITFANVVRHDDGDCGAPEPMVHRVQWFVDGDFDGWEIHLRRSIDGGAFDLLDDDLGMQGPYDDEFDGEEHDISDGTRTEYDYRVELVRSPDQSVLASDTVRVVSYPVPCES